MFRLLTSGRIVRVCVGFAVFMMHTMVATPLVDIVLIRAKKKAKLISCKRNLIGRN